MQDIVIIGAGMAGLSCAYTLYKNGVNSLILEQSDAVGGRIRTDNVDGFLLDRGFQILLTAYPTAQEVLDYQALNLQHFHSGAWVHVGKSFQKLGDPKRHRDELWQTLFANVGKLSDKLKINKLRRTLQHKSVEEIFGHSDVTVLETLRQHWGFSESMIDMFFRPFIGGIMLDHSLRTSNAMFEFVMKLFAEGTAAVPANGMQAIPENLASKMPASNLRLNTSVESIEKNAVILSDGERIEAETIVIATDAFSASQLVAFPQLPKFRSVHNVYFAADEAPMDAPVLALEAEPIGPINNLTVMSNVAPQYAPKGKHLISATILEDRPEIRNGLESSVRKHAKIWFGDQVNKWEHLHTYHIAQALPDQRNLPFTRQGFRQISPQLFVCGDYQNFGAIEGALLSGRRVAETILNQ
jgi:phytoene dehydrogenase-like protein